MKKTDDLYNFPCEFPLKAIAHKKPNIEKTVVEIIAAHAPEAKEAPIGIRPSKNNKYWAITVTITAQSKAQLDNIYMALNAHEDILMTL